MPCLVSRYEEEVVRDNRKIPQLQALNTGHSTYTESVIVDYKREYDLNRTFIVIAIQSSTIITAV